MGWVIPGYIAVMVANVGLIYAHKKTDPHTTRSRILKLLGRCYSVIPPLTLGLLAIAFAINRYAFWVAFAAVAGWCAFGNYEYWWKSKTQETVQ